MHTTIFMLAPPDVAIKNKSLQMQQTSNGQYQVLVSNCTPFTTLLTEDKTIAKHSDTVLLGHHKKMKMPKGSTANLFNLISDADASKIALSKLEEICNRNPFKRIYNHPKKILQTSRSKARFVFADIPGLRVPKTVRAETNGLEDLTAAIKRSSIEYPLIVREAGLHGGEGMYLIANEASLADLPSELMAEDAKLLIIEYLAQPNSDGLFHKNRIVFIDGKIYPRHSIYSDNWCVHASDRNRVMLKDKKLREQERHFLQHFERNLSDLQLNALNTMQQRLKLDLWGLDCAFNDDGEIVLFEANACMNFHDQDYGPNNEFRYIEPFQRNVRRAIKKLILQN